MESREPCSPPSAATPGPSSRFSPTVIAMSTFIQATPRGAEVAHSKEQRLVVLGRLSGQRPTRARPLCRTASDLYRRVATITSTGVAIAVLVALRQVRGEVGAPGKAAGCGVEGMSARVAAAAGASEPRLVDMGVGGG